MNKVWVERAGIVAALAGCVAWVSTVQYKWWYWHIEDAGITFAFARNWANGEGLVAFPGHERVEGYSDPLWMALLAAFQWLGFDSFVTSDWLGALFAALTLPVVWWVARELFADDEHGPDDITALVAPAVVAMSAPFGIWAGSGLENAQFGLLLALGMALTLREGRVGGFPFAALAWLGLALTRPEGILYAALGGLWGMVLDIVEKRAPLRTLGWLAVFFVPFGLYHAARYWYFAWEFPATYYAKLGESRVSFFNWNNRGWRQLREFGDTLGHIWAIPVYCLGLFGLHPVRTSLGLLAVVGFAASMQLTDWREGKVYAVIALTVLLPVLTNPRGWRVRVLAWGLAAIGLWFAVNANGDWMRGWRWMSLPAVPMGILFAAGVQDLARLARVHAAQVRLPKLVAVVLVAAAVAPVGTVNALYLRDVWRPNVSPQKVKKRVDLYQTTMKKLDLERVTILDHDMGAMVWWGYELGVIIDSKGLVDVACAQAARSNFRRDFAREYLFEENPFELMHAHGNTRYMLAGINWRKDYVEIEGYPPPKRKHRGNFVRRNLFLKRGMPEHFEPHTFGGDAVTVAVATRAPEVTPGTFFQLQVAVKDKAKRDIQVLGILDGPKRIVFDVPLAYGWIPPSQWRPAEWFVGHADVKLPKGKSTEGDYTLRLVVLGPDGVIPADVPVEDAIYAEGEAASEVVAKVKKRSAVEKAWTADLAKAKQAASEDKCKKAERHWHDARAHRRRNPGWAEKYRPPVARAIAGCWARRGDVESLRTARWWDFRAPEVTSIGQPLADQLEAEADAARESGDGETAFARYLEVLQIDPARSWARRHAEALRRDRLGVRKGPPTRIKVNLDPEDD